MDCAINQLGQMECNYIDRLRRIAPLLSDKEILESVAANTPNAANMGKTMKSEAASKLGIFNKPEVQAPYAQDLSQFMVPMEPEPEAPTAQDFAQFMKPMEPEPQAPTAQDFAQFMVPMEKSAAKEPKSKPKSKLKSKPKSKLKSKPKSIHMSDRDIRGITGVDLIKLIEKDIKEGLDHEQLVEKYSGANINFQERGTTPLMYVIRYGMTNIVRLLLDIGAETDLQDQYGKTALMWASIDGHTDIVKLLLDKGVKPNIQERYGFTALMYASESGHENTVKLLLENGADPTLKNEDGDTALHWVSTIWNMGEKDTTVGGSRINIIKLLLDNGADVNIQDDEGKTALINAERSLMHAERKKMSPTMQDAIRDIVELLDYHTNLSGRTDRGGPKPQAGLGRRRSRKKKKSKNKKLKRGGKRSNKKSGKTLKKKRK
jgi:hypothetical protein